MTVCDEILNVLMFGSAIGWICAGVYVAKPNLHGIKFEPGMCNFSSVETIALWDDLPTCSCGKGCSEEYPCVTLRGYFWRQSADNISVLEPGTFHASYNALKKNCLYLPSCENDFLDNAEQVYRYYAKTVIPRVNDVRYPYYYNTTYFNFSISETFSCWGYDNDMYFEHSFKAVWVYLSLIGPGALLLIGIFCSFMFGSDNHKDSVKSALQLPLWIIVGASVFIWEIMSAFLPDKCSSAISNCGQCIYDGLRRVFCCKHAKSTPEVSQDQDISLNDVDVASRGRSTRSISSSSALSFNTTFRLAVGASDPGFTPHVPGPTYDVLGFDVAASESDPGFTPNPVPGPTYDVLGSDVLPPPPSYDDAINVTDTPGAPVPSYEDILRNTYN